ncbi:MAG: OB-fold nucleic acid binding domain-containing protein [Candidatus Bathyarchaeota archaeon]|nr:OB-fold nucleic acid binding domain-containing protein [Candidatus Bathyarchaeota archaeon]
MTTQDLIAEIAAKNPQLTPSVILERLEAERRRCDGLLGDETLLRLIAAKSEVTVQQNHFQNSNVLSSERLFSGLYDVTVAGRLIAVFPAKTFQGQEKSGKFATLMLADEAGLLRVVLWNEQAELVERGELKSGQALRLLHGYTRQDRYGKVELHMGVKSQIEIQPHDSSAPSIERFTAKIGDLTAGSGSVHLLGAVKAVYSKSSFPRGSDGDGVVLRLALRDESGEAVVVVWNEKVEEIERVLRDSPRLLLVNARVKEAKNGAFEVHVDSGTAIQAQS